MRRSTILLLSLCLLTLAAGTASAGMSPRSVLVKRWHHQADKVEAALEAGKYKSAETRAVRLLDDLVQRMGRGQAVKATLANVLTLRALAEHGLTEDRDAVWDWYVAQALDPTVATRDWSRFEPLDAFLRDNRVSDEAAESRKLLDLTTPQVGKAGAIDPPEKQYAPDPQYPQGARKIGVHGRLLVKARLLLDGRLHRPRLLQQLPGSTLTVAALETLRTWRYRPARLDGKPVPCVYALTIDFHTE